MRIAVTGAGGFIGKELVCYLSNQGHEVLRLQRESITGPMDRFFDMRSPHSIPDLAGIDALIHTAYIRHEKNLCPDSAKANICTTLALEKACHSAGVKLIFLSCMSAHADSKSANGRHKYELEQKLDISRDLILRLGLVIGRGGITEQIKSQILKSNFIPIADRHLAIQVIDIQDLCRIVDKGLSSNAVGIYNVAKETPYKLVNIYHTIAEKLNRKPIFIPAGTLVPDRMGIKDVKIFDSKSDMDRLGVSITEPGKNSTT